ncbi:MAG: arsenate reductase ArsC [Gammaproteobacteria bacterium]|nr:arsenate reductase ArsC [Gammaproteobacteria bacterium]MDE2348204.1 arsenate reductase ArsC [Gammaproteobacteria bacterium]
MSGRPFHVLFLCTANSARSILAEALLNRLGGGRFRAFSAGSHPRGTVNPCALELLRQRGFAVADLRSKSWDEFAAPGAMPVDCVITVCDAAAGEACPLWPGQPLTAHWGIVDPAAVGGSDEERMAAFARAFDALEARIRRLSSLPTSGADRDELQRQLREIGRMPGAVAPP